MQKSDFKHTKDMNEKEKKSDMRLQLLLVLILLLLGFCGGYDIAKKRQPSVVSDTVTVVRWDTAFIDRPTEIVRYIIRRDTVKLFDNSDEPEIVIKDDSTVIIPIQCAVYHDSTENAKYTAFLSGYKPSLDSINIECRSTTTIITNTEVEKARRWGVGVQVGVGVSTKGVAPYAGVGVFYRLW